MNCKDLMSYCLYIIIENRSLETVWYVVFVTKDFPWIFVTFLLSSIISFYFFPKSLMFTSTVHVSSLWDIHQVVTAHLQETIQSHDCSTSLKNKIYWWLNNVNSKEHNWSERPRGNSPMKLGKGNFILRVKINRW